MHLFASTRKGHGHMRGVTRRNGNRKAFRGAASIIAGEYGAIGTRPSAFASYRYSTYRRS
eukprot:1732443-Prymnesium_polylepis.3